MSQSVPWAKKPSRQRFDLGVGLDNRKEGRRRGRGWSSGWCEGSQRFYKQGCLCANRVVLTYVEVRINKM